MTQTAHTVSMDTVLETTRHLEASRAAEHPGRATGAVHVLLRLEGLALFAVAASVYAALGGTLGFFAACFLVPDLALAAYLAGPRIGSIAYNATHSLLGPAAVALGFLVWGPSALWVALVWAAHIGIDRAIGFGLKYRTGFRHTHLS
jgi:hypothetical protein